MVTYTSDIETNQFIKKYFIFSSEMAFITKCAYRAIL